VEGTTVVTETGIEANAVIGAGVSAVAGIVAGPRETGGTRALAVTEGRAAVGTMATKAKTEAGVVAGTVPRIKGRTTAATVARIVAEVMAATEMGVDLARP